MKSTATLSNEQKLRIKENKQKAIEKRLQKQNQPFLVNAEVQKAGATILSTAKEDGKSHFVAAAAGQQNKTDSILQYPRPDSTLQHPRPDSTLQHPRPSVSWQSNTQPQGLSTGAKVATKGIEHDKFYGVSSKPLRGQCVLISKDRFEVRIAFSQPVIDVFKTVNSRMYDATKRIWSFSISDHEALLKAMKGLQPHVQVEPLPKVFLQVFAHKAKSEKPDFVPQADLSNVDKVLVDSLMPFQKEGVNFGVHLGGRVLIADDMGLGKTLQAICLACIYRNKWPLLIVTPSSVRFDWAQQLKRWVPSLDPSRITVAVTGRDDPSGGLVNIISYDLVSRKAKELLSARFKIIIMDESHFLKNSKTVRTKTAMPLLQAADHVILLSGTPALSRPSELYTQIMAISPRMFKFHDFGVRYCDGKEQPWGWDYSGSSNMEELQLLLETKIMIRRLKQDVLTQLPAKRRQMVILDPMSVAVSKSLIHASKVMEKKLSGMERRGALLQYFHETCRVKLQAVRDYIVDMLAAEKKFLIFAHHQDMMNSIEETVVGENVQYIRIDGNTTAEQRHFFCNKFQTKEECRVAILSITAANAGLNLSSASIVVFAELFWNPGILVQAEDRAHRLGQQDSVLVYYLVAQKSADDFIWPIVQNKLQVLGRAGLAKEDFRDTDTTHIKDPKQQELLEMFRDSFIEETLVEDQSDELQKIETACASKHVALSSPVKRKGTSSLQTASPSKRKKLSPNKNQLGINKFFSVEGIKTARSPQKVNTTEPRKLTGSMGAPSSAVNQDEEPSCQGILAVDQTLGASRLPFPKAQDPTNSLCDQVKSAFTLTSGFLQSEKGQTSGMPSSQCESENGEWTLSELAADVDWDEDF